MREFCGRGVVRGGQIVLDVPLDLPDGTVLAVSEFVRSRSEADKLKMLTLLNRIDLLDDAPGGRRSSRPGRRTSRSSFSKRSRYAPHAKWRPAPSNR